MIPYSTLRTREEAAKDKAESAAFLASYRARGGYDGALARGATGPLAVVGNMPFPGHRHCGEWK